MRMSEAINLGSAILRPKAGVLNQGSEGCALGMAFAAFPNAKWDWAWQKQYHEAHLPCGCHRRDSLMWGGCVFYEIEGGVKTADIIVHLFNYHVMTIKDWTLERLVDWVASVEPTDNPEVCEVQNELELEKETVNVPTKA